MQLPDGLSHVVKRNAVATRHAVATCHAIAKRNDVLRPSLVVSNNEDGKVRLHRVPTATSHETRGAPPHPVEAPTQRLFTRMSSTESDL